MSLRVTRDIYAYAENERSSQKNWIAGLNKNNLIHRFICQSQSQSQRPRVAKNNRDQKSHACAPLSVVRAASTVSSRYHSPLYGFSHVIFKSEN